MYFVKTLTRYFLVLFFVRWNVLGKIDYATD